MNFEKNRVLHAALVSGLLVLAGCGGSGSGQAGNTGTLNLSISDSPIKDAAKVCIKFDGVQLKKADEEAPIDIDFSPVVINLFENQGAVSEPLVSAEVEAGVYEWIRLKVDAVAGSGAGTSDPDSTDPVCNDTTNGSYIVTKTNSVFNIRVPSGNQTGLKLIKDIVIPANSSGNYTAEWDLGMSFIDPPGQGDGEAIMKPVVKLVANNEVGTLEGTVTSDFFAVQDGQDVATCPADSEFAPTVYVFDSDGIGDNDVDIKDELPRDPVASGLVAQDMDDVNMPYVYEIGFLLAGSYEVALSCDGRTTFIPTNGKPATIEVGGLEPVNFTSDDLPVSE